ncbi:MAG TPA: MTAP family purine nucleoside phosphorylase [Abditibacteriaceae bacterium]|jgi:5'-methylthioadenosine phosphorylase
MNGLLAIIGGTGVDLRGEGSPLYDLRDETVETRWGTARVTLAKLGERDIVFLHRHSPAPGTHIPPHRINYRANIAALKKLGVTAILASTAVGSLRREWAPGTLVLLSQFIDATTTRDKTFFDDRAVHIDVTEPYCPRLRALLGESAEDLNLSLHDGGTYLCTDGPRFETPAEIRLYSAWGADVVGMTGVPEVVLAREANISYAGVSIVTNAAAGVLPQPLTQSEVLDAMREALPNVVQLFLAAAADYSDDPTSASRRVTAEFGSPDVC